MRSWLIPGDFLSENKAVVLNVEGMLALIIDEFDDIPAGFCEGLREEGYLLEMARNRGEALWLLESSAFDVVIRYGSLEKSLEWVKTLRQESEVPLLFLTSAAAAQERVELLDAGVDDILTMPLAFQEVAARLRALRRRARTVEPLEISHGTVKLDLAARIAYREVGDTVVGIELTAREFAVLELMMRNPRAVLTRSRLTEHVWGLGAFANSNVIDQLVSRLRAKLERPFGVHEIATVRGVGYRFVPERENLLAS